MVGRRRYVRPRRPPGLVIAYMQARLPAGRARPIIERQRRVVEDFVSYFDIPVDLWYWRAKGLQPLPTPEQLIAEGRVYCLIAERFDKLRGCKGQWPELWEVASQHRVRHILIQERADFTYNLEPSVFREGWKLPGPRPAESWMAYVSWPEVRHPTRPGGGADDGATDSP